MHSLATKGVHLYQNKPPLPLEMTGFLHFEGPGLFFGFSQFSPEFSPVKMGWPGFQERR